jgi:hypothetical protein
MNFGNGSISGTRKTNTFSAEKFDTSSVGNDNDDLFSNMQTHKAEYNQVISNDSMNTISDIESQMSNHSKLGDMSCCYQCQCCTTLLEHMEELNKKVNYYENVLNITPAILEWIENIRQLYLNELKKNPNQKNVPIKKILSDSSADTTNDTSKMMLKKEAPLIALNNPEFILESETKSPPNVYIEQAYKIPEIVIERVGEPPSDENIL